MNCEYCGRDITNQYVDYISDIYRLNKQQVRDTMNSMRDTAVCNWYCANKVPINLISGGGRYVLSLPALHLHIADHLFV